MRGEKELGGGGVCYLNDNYALGCYDIRCLTHSYYYEVPLSTKRQMKVEFYWVLNNECHLCQIFKSIFS